MPRNLSPNTLIPSIVNTHRVFVNERNMQIKYFLISNSPVCYVFITSYILSHNVEIWRTVRMKGMVNGLGLGDERQSGRISNYNGTEHKNNRNYHENVWLEFQRSVKHRCVGSKWINSRLADSYAKRVMGLFSFLLF